MSNFMDEVDNTVSGTVLTPTVSAKIEKNSRGVNWEVSVSFCASPQQLDEMMAHAIALVKARAEQEADSV